jgi:hypothetical protein
MRENHRPMTLPDSFARGDLEAAGWRTWDEMRAGALADIPRDVAGQLMRALRRARERVRRPGDTQRRAISDT